MFSITFFISANLPPIVLLFKGQESLDAALASFNAVDVLPMHMGEVIVSLITDDFGQKLYVQKPMLAVLVQDLKLAQQADIERGVHHALTQAMAQDRAKANPTLAAHMRGMNGPAVMSPFPMNGGRA